MFGEFAESLYLCTRKQENDAPVAQLVEHLTLNQGVQGSNPCGCTKLKEIDQKFISFFIYEIINDMLFFEKYKPCFAIRCSLAENLQHH